MKILFVTPSFFPAIRFGGPIVSTLGLCSALAARPNVSLRVLSTDASDPNSSERLRLTSNVSSFSSGFDVYYCRTTFGVDFSIEMMRRLTGMIRWADVVHLTGVYSPPTIPTLMACRAFRKPIVWSPRGSLQRWVGGHRLRAKTGFERICDYLLKPVRSELHVTSTEEATASLRRVHKAGVTIIPNGVELPQISMQRDWLRGHHLNLLCMGRIDPIKGIENLLDALALLPKSRLSLEICGDGNAPYVETLQKRIGALGLTGNVKFLGHLSGAQKTNAFLAADICVVPSHSENFGMVVAESLAHGVPVIVSKGAPWGQVVTHDCGVWVENSPASLARAICDLSTRDLAAMGARGRRWMEADFSWDTCAARMFETYEKLVHESNR